MTASFPGPFTGGCLCGGSSGMPEMAEMPQG